MSSRLVLPILAAALMNATAVRAQVLEPPWVGHWVNVDPMGLGMYVLAVEPDGTAHRVFPAPQFGASYEFVRDRLTLTVDGEPPLSGFVLRGDTLRHEEWLPLVRISGRVDASSGIGGTWRRMPVEPDDSWFMTFRSDGQVILLVGSAGIVTTLSPDAARLVFTGGPGPDTSYRAWVAGDTLAVENGGERRFVRRPWGCFGNADFDGAAAECR